jgi:hypothetical protein
MRPRGTSKRLHTAKDPDEINGLAGICFCLLFENKHGFADRLRFMSAHRPSLFFLRIKCSTAWHMQQSTMLLNKYASPWSPM